MKNSRYTDSQIMAILKQATAHTIGNGTLNMSVHMAGVS